MEKSFDLEVQTGTRRLGSAIKTFMDLTLNRLLWHGAVTSWYCCY